MIFFYFEIKFQFQLIDYFGSLLLDHIKPIRTWASNSLSAHSIAVVPLAAVLQSNSQSNYISGSEWGKFLCSVAVVCVFVSGHVHMTLAASGSNVATENAPSCGDDYDIRGVYTYTSAWHAQT